MAGNCIVPCGAFIYIFHSGPQVYLSMLLTLCSGVPADKVGQEAGEMLLNQLYHGGCVDDFLQDQVVTLGIFWTS